MSAPSSIKRRRTFWPSGPVWCVFSCMPRIAEDNFLTSSSDFATFTPPPWPRPPAWICAFTTQTLPPSFFAASTASSTLNAGKPRGVVTPNLRKISLPWYSWIFIPPWIPFLHRLGCRFKRMALVELERLRAVVALFLHFAGKGLDRRGRHAGEHLGEMRAAAHPAQQRLYR